MDTFFLFGKYSSAAAKTISAERTAKARQLIEGLGGRAKDMYALLGEYDLVLIVEFPRMGEAMKASVALKAATDITFFTVAAMPVEQFDQMFS